MIMVITIVIRNYISKNIKIISLFVTIKINNIKCSAGVNKQVKTQSVEEVTH